MGSIWKREFIRTYDVGSGLFANMKQTESGEFPDENIYWEVYESEYLDPGAELKIYFLPADDDNPSSIAIFYDVNIWFADGTWYLYEYDLSAKTLTYRSNDPDNTKNKMFLYDILLEDWFEANPGTRFSMDDLGEYTFIDETLDE